MGRIGSVMRFGGEMSDRGMNLAKNGALLPFWMARAVLGEALKPPHIPEVLAEQYLGRARDAKTVIVTASHYGIDGVVLMGEAELATALVDANAHPLIAPRVVDEIVDEVNSEYFMRQTNPFVRPEIAQEATRIVAQHLPTDTAS